MMNVADTDKFVSFVTSKWEATLATLPSYYSKADPESTKRLWFVHSWRDMLSNYTTLTSDHKSVSDEQSARATLEALKTFVGSLTTDSKVAADICQYVSSTTPDLSMDDIKHMKDSVTKEWRKAWDDLPAMAKIPDEHTCRSGWFELEYKSLLTKTAKSTSDTVPSRFWSKILSLAAKNDLSQENHVKALINKATQADFQTFCAVVESSWTTEWEPIPEYAKKDQELSKVLWFRQCYVKLVEMAFATKTASVSQQDADTISSRFWSKISSLAAKDDLSQEDQVKDLTKKATDADFQTFCEIVESSWKAEWARLPEFAKENPDIQKQLWFQEHYVQLVEKALTSKLAHGQEAAANMAGIAGLNQKRNMGPNAMDMFSSPAKRRRPSGTQASAQSPLVEMTAAEIHKKDVLSTQRHSFVGFLLDMPEDDRTVKVYNRREKAEEDISVLTCLFADVTGPILFDLWREAVQTFRNTVSQNSSNTNLLLFKITDFAARSMSSQNRACYPTCKKMVATEKTVCELLTCSSLPSVNPRSNLTLDRTLMLSDFGSLRKALPFIANVRGVVATTEPESESQSGVPMKSFKVHDNRGQYLHCMMFGRHVENELIVVGNDVAIFFGTAQNGLNNSAGSFWLYDDAHVILLERNCIVLKETVAIDLR